MKISQISVELKQGLPNYSSRSATVVCTADADESLDIAETIIRIHEEVREAWIKREVGNVTKTQ